MLMMLYTLEVGKKLKNTQKLTHIFTLKLVVGDKFEVLINDARYIIDSVEKHCSYKISDLTSIPCHFVCACVNYMRQDLISYIDNIYAIEKYVETYGNI